MSTFASRCSSPAPMPGYFATSSPIFSTPLLEPPPRSVGLSTASIRRSNDAASNSTLLPENFTRSHQLLKSKII
jgi:hypothetical protein